MTNHPDVKIVLLTYGIENDIPALQSGGSHSLVDRAARQAEFVTDFQVDPTGQIAVVSCYAGKLKVIKLEDGELGQAFDVSCVYCKYTRLGESHPYRINVLNAGFLRSTCSPLPSCTREKRTGSPLHSCTSIIADRYSSCAAMSYYGIWSCLPHILIC